MQPDSKTVIKQQSFSLTRKLSAPWRSIILKKEEITLPDASDVTNDLTMTKQSVELSKNKEFFSVGSRKINSDLSSSGSCGSFKDY